MTDSTTPQDSAAMSPASDGSVAELLETIAAFMDQTDRFKGGAVPVVTPEATKARTAFFRLRKLFDAAPSRHTLIDAERTLIEKLTWESEHPKMGRSIWVTPQDRETAHGLLERTK